MVCFLRLNNDKKCKPELGSCLGRMSANGRTAHDALVHRLQIYLDSQEKAEPLANTEEWRLTPLVRSKTWSGTRKPLGLTSSLRLPTAPHPQLSQRSNIRSRRHLVRYELVVQAMSRKKCDDEGRARGP
jgi:hypothetical protein